MGKTWVGGVFAMAQPLVSDALWAKIKPLLPPPKPRRFRFPGRKPLDLRKVLTGIIFVLKTGIPWEELPQEMGCGCGNACIKFSCPSFTKPTALIGRAPRSTAATCAPWEEARKPGKTLPTAAS